VWITIAVIGGLAFLAVTRGWFKTGLVLVVLTGVLLAGTAIGPHLQQGAVTGVNGVISTLYAFFH
jgi:hypothetical protein